MIGDTGATVEGSADVPPASFQFHVSNSRQGGCLLVRPASVADLSAIRLLAGASPTAAHWSAPQYDQLFNASGPRRVILVVENSLIENRLGNPVTSKDDPISGFAVARALEHEWEIENIVVAAAERRRGLASQLLDELLTAARKSGATSVFLEVRESNDQARALYEKLLFVESGRRVRYYREPIEDAVIYRRAFE